MLDTTRAILVDLRTDVANFFEQWAIYNTSDPCATSCSFYFFTAVDTLTGQNSFASGLDSLNVNLHSKALISLLDRLYVINDRQLPIKEQTDQAVLDHINDLHRLLSDTTLGEKKSWQPNRMFEPIRALLAKLERAHTQIADSLGISANSHTPGV